MIDNSDELNRKTDALESIFELMSVLFHRTAIEQRIYDMAKYRLTGKNKPE